MPRMLFDGIVLESRRYSESLLGLARQADGIDGHLGRVIKRLYVDDKNCSFYEVDLLDDVNDISVIERIEERFRKRGYNGLVIKHKGATVAEFEPYWNELDEAVVSHFDVGADTNLGKWLNQP